MSFQLINVHSSVPIGGEAVPAVNLRDLHQALGARRDFSTWAKGRMNEAQADKGMDYVITKSGDNTKTGRPQLDYIVTLDLAKEIAMLERNEKGKQVRRYFIRVEKEFRAKSLPQPQPSPTAAWLVTKLLEITPAKDLLRLLKTKHAYGSLAKNGRPRTGWRAPAYVAAKNRQDDARIFQEGMIRLNVTVQLELPNLSDLLLDGADKLHARKEGAAA